MTLIGNTDDSLCELAMPEVDINMQYPFTGCTMHDPVQNVCYGHIHDRTGILTYIKQKSSQAK